MNDRAFWLKLRNKFLGNKSHRAVKAHQNALQAEISGSMAFKYVPLSGFICDDCKSLIATDGKCQCGINLVLALQETSTPQTTTYSGSRDFMHEYSEKVSQNTA